MKTTSSLTSIQAWFRDYSNSLKISFNSSDRIEHNVSKGESREYQIFDTLSNLLPVSISVEPKAVIVNTEDKQSPKFDGALVDRILWPRLFTFDKTPIALIESVLAAVEIKSYLNKSELEDIFGKSRALRSMKCYSSLPPLITAFAYNCANLSLSFFDFAILFKYASEYSPSLICILDKGLFGLGSITGEKVTLLHEPDPRKLPILCHTCEDSLLVYIYFLSNWAGMESTVAEIYRYYNDNVFSSLECFYFGEDFLNLVASDEAIKNTARKCFERKVSADIKDLYAEARKAIDLPI